MLPGTQPVNIRPYRHPHVQKDAIESMVKELLEDGVIKHSQSSFTSPVVMALMNDVFREFLRKFTLVLFDEILVYNKSLTEHVHHLTVVLSKIRDHSLFAKKSKCAFEFSCGILRPCDLNSMSSYRSCKGSSYAVLASTSKYQTVKRFLRPNWTNEAQSAFLLLKVTMIKALVLGNLNFNKPFIVETDASGVRLGAILQQDGHHIAHLSKNLSRRHQALSTYKKEFLAVLLALEKCRGYLLDRHFMIKTDHYSLKYLLDQRITTLAQMKWLSKLMRFDYEVVYKKGKDNVVVNALSRREGDSE
ncbi:putative mitochondrial protein [Tanacetum coccineum]